MWSPPEHPSEEGRRLMIRGKWSYANLSKRTKAAFKKDPDCFLRQISGVIHVGANVGQERDRYRHHGLYVVWIEPIPEVFEMLQANIQGYPNQTAFQCLVTDQDDTEYTFHVSNNEGASSSIFELKLHKDIWPEVDYDKTITLRSTTLPCLLKRERINASKYDALIMDTQGSESLILKGAVPILGQFRFIKTEVPDFESYAGCCQLDDINVFLKQQGFQEISRHKFAERAGGGSYYDVVFERKA